MREGWKQVRLGHALTQYLAPIKVEPDELYTNLGVQWYAGGTFQREPKRGADMKATRLFKVRPGQFIYNRMFVTEGSFALIAKDHADGVVSNEFPVFDVNQTIMLPEYLLLHFQQAAVWASVADEAKGTTKSRRRWKESQFLEYRMMLPSLAEQRRIVDLIAAVDDAIEAAEGEAHAYDAFWWEITSMVASQLQNSSTCTLGSIADIGGGLSKSKSLAEAEDAKEYPFLRAANVKRRYLDLEEMHTISVSPTKAARAALEPGDILMNEGGDRDKLGRGAIWRGEVPGTIHQNHVFRVRLSDARFSSEFVSAWANSFGQGWFDVEASQTTGIASISKTTLSKFPIPVIPLAEQERWAELLGECWSNHDAARATADALRTLRSNLLTVLLSGEHEIPESYDQFLNLDEEAAA